MKELKELNDLPTLGGKEKEKTTADPTGQNLTVRTAAAATGTCFEGRNTTVDPTGHNPTAAATGTC